MGSAGSSGKRIYSHSVALDETGHPFAECLDSTRAIATGDCREAEVLYDVSGELDVDIDGVQSSREDLDEDLAWARRRDGTSTKFKLASVLAVQDESLLRRHDMERTMDCKDERKKYEWVCLAFINAISISSSIIAQMTRIPTDT